MTIRKTAPVGAPCWADLWTSDVAGSRRFYGELFGWDAEPPDPEFGGYFNFLRDGERIAGAMGDMGEDGTEAFLAANDTWNVYFATDDLNATLKAAEAAGAEVDAPAMTVGELGHAAHLADPGGAAVKLWQPRNHPGFTVLDEPGAPSWFELHTRDHAAAVAFYRDVLHLGTEVQGDTDEFRYTTLQGPSGCGQVAGIMDATAWLADGEEPHWSVYWCTDDVDSSVAAVQRLGGSVVMPAEDTPYGRLAEVADPTGARFKLRALPDAFYAAPDS